MYINQLKFSYLIFYTFRNFGNLSSSDNSNSTRCVGNFINVSSLFTLYLISHHKLTNIKIAEVIFNESFNKTFL